jgi:hypothetical protein
VSIATWDPTSFAGELVVPGSDPLARFTSRLQAEEDLE